MAITNTKIADLVPNEKVLGNTVNILLAAANELVTSGLAVGGPEVEAVANGGPRKASVPFLDPLSTSEVNISSDDITVVGSVGALTADEFSAIRHDLNYGWGFADLTRMVTLYDAKGGVGAGIAAYWAGIYQKLATSAMKGAMAADAALTFSDGLSAFSLDLVIDGVATAGMYADQFDTLIVSPKTYSKMQKLNSGNTFVEKSKSDIGFATFAGYKLIRSTAFGDDETVACRAGALSFGEGSPPGMVPIEIERLANAGRGGGAEILHSRRSVVVHPQGFSYTGAVAPAYAALETSSNWALAVPVEQIGFRRIMHTS